MLVTREIVLAAEKCSGTVKKYGTEDLRVIHVLPKGSYENNDVLVFNVEDKAWHLWNQDSYWDLFESEMMLTVMRAFSNEEAVLILESFGAFSENNLEKTR